MDRSPPRRRIPRKDGPAARFMRVSHRSRQPQLDFRAGTALTPDLQFSANVLRAFAHPRQTKVPVPTFLPEYIRFNPSPVIPNADTNVLCAVPEFNFDSPRPRMVERVAHGFGGD